MFSCEFCEISKNPFFFTEHLRLLLLDFSRLLIDVINFQNQLFIFVSQDIIHLVRTQNFPKN